jgi:hypothetical protein
MSGIRIVPHEESIEVRYPDGRESKYFYFDDKNALRRQLQKRTTREEAVKRAKAWARQG